MRVRILGGGVAGLATALALEERTGVTDIVVYERMGSESAAHESGHGVMLMQNGVRALRAMGADVGLRSATPLSRMWLQDSNGVLLRTEALKDVYCVTRASVVNGLRNRLRHTRIVYGAAVTRVDLDAGLVGQVVFQDGTTLDASQADLFVGSEGIGSPMWSALNPGQVRGRSRVWELVTTTELPDFAARLGKTFLKTMFADRGAAFGLLAPTAHQVIGFVQLDRMRWPVPDRTASHTEIRALLTSVLAGAPDPIPEWLSKVDLSSFHIWQPADADLPEHAHAANAALVGDAFHPLLPFTSQGVCSALEDALVLADAVGARRAGGLSTALERYARARKDEVMPFLDGGRRILANFVDPRRVLTHSYVDGAASSLGVHLGLTADSLRHLFAALDTDGNGALSPSELARALELFEIELSPTERVAFLAHLDSDGNGSVDPDEFVEALGGIGETTALVRRIRDRLSPRKISLTTLEARARQLMNLLDADGDRAVGGDELDAAMRLLGMDVSPGAGGAAMRALDLNGDGRVSTDELRGALTRDEAPASVTRIVHDLVPASNDDGDPWFAHHRVDLGLLRQRSYNYRWAEQAPGVIPLSAADLDLPIAEPIVEAIQRYVAGGIFPYGPAEGLPELRAAAASHLRARRQMPCTTSEIFVANSAASALYLTAQFAMDVPRAEAIIPDPVDFLLERSVVAAGGTVRRFPMRARADGSYGFDIDEVEALIRPGRTRLLGVCNPHNPLGRVWSRAELEQLAQLAIKHDLWIMADEVWSDIIHAPNVFTAMSSLGPEVARRTFTTLGFSKGYGLAGLRLGLLVTPDATKMSRIVGLSHADETAYGVSTLSQVAGTAALEHGGEWLARFVLHLTSQRDLAVSRLNAIPGVRCHTPEGTFVVFPDVSALTDDVDGLVTRLREEHKVAVVPGSPRFFGPSAAGHIRLALATSRTVLSVGLDRVENGLRSLRDG
jgi:aspartate/methionine/tyrosine aminotransferase/2-polyprenyl-6-methoxyphenol hydroxylase-like FAD-dependent oxidoreductase